MRAFLSTLALASALAPCAFAQEGEPPSPPADQASTQRVDTGTGQYIWFSGGFVGSTDYDYSVADGELDSGFGFAGGWGVEIGRGWRAELGVAYRSQPIETVNGIDADLAGAGDVTVLSLDINAYYDFATGESVFKPYVGAGLGVGAMSVEDGFLNPDTGSAVTVQFMAGGAFEMSDKAALFLEGRYQIASLGLDTDGDEYDTEEYLAFGAFGAYAGIRVGF